MRLALAALVLLSASPSAAIAAGAPRGPGCRLSTAECLVVAQEIAMERVLQDEDERDFGFGMTPYDRAKALLRRHFARVTARTPLLPVRIGNELARLRLCSALDDDATRDSTTNIDPACR